MCSSDLFPSHDRRGAIVVSWFNKNKPQVKDYFIDINNPTPEEITMFALEFGDKLAVQIKCKKCKIIDFDQ